jgi:hypothetical protein
MARSVRPTMVKLGRPNFSVGLLEHRGSTPQLTARRPPPDR